VILSAGSIGSLHILQLSGVGAPEYLGGVGVAVHHDLPGVGQNLQDHYSARVSYAVRVVATVNERSRGIPLAAEVLRYLVTARAC
jgi:choline dehydrogenase